MYSVLTVGRKEVGFANTIDSTMTSRPQIPKQLVYVIQQLSQKRQVIVSALRECVSVPSIGNEAAEQPA